MTAEQVQKLNELVEVCGLEGLVEADLDDRVHEAGARHAASINNSGVLGQLAFLLQTDGFEETLKFLKGED
ncbi:MAG: hypothetical protein JJ979_03530 [Roseibium sp.]|nr:hypothetical protein [Roseibium sp.]